MPTSRLCIDLSAVEHNVATLRHILSGTSEKNRPDSSRGHHPAICAVIKQDAYGLGAPRLARKLSQLGIDLLAVYSLDEARALVELPIKSPILVLMPVRGIERSDPLFSLLVAKRLHLVLHGTQHALELSSFCSKLGLQIPVHVQVDTGMSRGGCLPPEAIDVVRHAAESSRFLLAGLMTHFSSPGHDEPFTREQAKLFRTVVDASKPTLTTLAKSGGKPVMVHAANSAAALRSASWHATMVRIGQGLFGFAAEDLTGEAPAEFAAAASALTHAVRWLAPIVHLHDIPATWPVGYNRTWRARRESRIGVVPVGYANGYPIQLGNQSVVRLTGRSYPKMGDSTTPQLTLMPQTDSGQGMYAPVVGRISMDQITIDLTDVPEQLCRPGMEVELVGTERDAPNALPQLASRAGTITHALLCGIAASVERTFVVSQQEVPAASAVIPPRIAPVMTQGMNQALNQMPSQRAAL